MMELPRVAAQTIALQNPITFVELTGEITETCVSYRERLVRGGRTLQWLAIKNVVSLFYQQTKVLKKDTKFVTAII